MNKTIDAYIKDSGFKKSYIAKEIGVSNQTLTRRLNHTRKWQPIEIYRLVRLLDIPLADLEQVFDINYDQYE